MRGQIKRVGQGGRMVERLERCARKKYLSLCVKINPCLSLLSVINYMQLYHYWEHIAWITLLWRHSTWSIFVRLPLLLKPACRNWYSASNKTIYTCDKFNTISQASKPIFNLYGKSYYRHQLFLTTAPAHYHVCVCLRLIQWCLLWCREFLIRHKAGLFLIVLPQALCWVS